MAKDSKKSVKQINELIDLMEERNLSELEIDGERIKIVRGGRSAAAPAVADVVAPVAPQAAPSPSSAPSPAQDSDSEFAGHAGAVKSPIVGTAYMSPQPGADPFVKAGDKVSEGQVLLIIEAMKVMNSIQAHRSGTLVHLLVTDGDPIEYGQVLAVIE